MSYLHYYYQAVVKEHQMYCRIRAMRFKDDTG